MVQHGPSTLIVSLPSKWTKDNNIKKGDEIEVEVRGKEVVIRNDKTIEYEERDIDMKKFSLMISRVLHALYKKGVDVIKVTVDSPEQINIIQNAISKETVGYEIVDQSKNVCTIRSVASDIGEFDMLLKRIFLLQLTMCHDSLEALKKGEYKRLKQIAILEETNNRLTTMCRRAINKRSGSTQCNGPMYYVIEDLENIADEYKYMFNYVADFKGKVKIDEKVLDLYSEVNRLFETFFKLFYKFDENMVVEIADKRKKMIKEIYALMDAHPNNVELHILHHLIIITQKIFCFLGPYLVMRL